MKNIKLKIESFLIDRDSTEQQMELMTDGQIYEVDDEIYLIYDESEITGNVGCKTQLKIMQNNVELSRIKDEDNIHSEMKFNKNERYEGFYDTPYGSIPLELLTNELRSDITPDGKGCLFIDYTICLKGLVENRARLNIEVFQGDYNE